MGWLSKKSDREQQQASSYSRPQPNGHGYSHNNYGSYGHTTYSSGGQQGNVGTAQPMTSGGNASGKPGAAGGGDPKKAREEARNAAIAEARRRLEIQKEALKNLPPSTLFIMLYVRNEPPALNDFH